MASDLKNSAAAAATTVADVIQDAQELVKQQLAMFKAEVREDVRKVQEAMWPMAAGVALAAVACGLLSLMLAHLVHDVCPPMPLWGAYGVVGAAMAALGAGAFYAGKKRFDSFNPLPDKTAQTVQENVQWLSQPK